MVESFFARDIVKEKAVAKFLDNHFYPLMTTDFYRFSDIDAQMEGKDVCFTLLNLHKIVVDEKAQTSYINKNLPTFAFEVAYSKDNKLKDGWLFDESKKTQFYFLIWVKATKTYGITHEDITELDCLLVDRKDITDYLVTKNITNKTLKDDIKHIVEENKSQKQTYKSDNEVYFYYSTQLAEKSINIVMRRNILDKLAFKHFKITKDEIRMISKALSN